MTVAAMRYVLSRIAEALGCSPDDDEDLVEAARRLVADRDDARAEVERLRARVRSVDRSTAYEGKAFSDGESSQEDLAVVASERDEARAEVEWLRKALRAIAAKRNGL